MKPCKWEKTKIQLLTHPKSNLCLANHKTSFTIHSFSTGNFLDTLVFNLLLLRMPEKFSQFVHSSPRWLNRGICHTLKFSLLFFTKLTASFTYMHLWSIHFIYISSFYLHLQKLVQRLFGDDVLLISGSILNFENGK